MFDWDQGIRTLSVAAMASTPLWGNRSCHSLTTNPPRKELCWDELKSLA